jgi:hypothetical protein
MEGNQGKNPGKPYFYEGFNDEILLRKMVELTSDYYWEQDAHYRFTLIRHRDAEKEQTLAEAFIGKTWWELGGELEASEGSSNGQFSPQLSHQPFHDLIVRYAPVDKRERYFSISGQPVFDDKGIFSVTEGSPRMRAIRKFRSDCCAWKGRSAGFCWMSKNSPKLCTTQCAQSVFLKTGMRASTGTWTRTRR